MTMSLVPTPAYAVVGSANITPIESNLSVGFNKKPTASSTSNGYDASLAIDGKTETYWLSESNSSGQWFKLDLGGKYDNIRKTELTWNEPDKNYQYIIEVSPDDSTWTTVIDKRSTNSTSQVQTDLFYQTGFRYIRVTVTNSPMGAPVGIKEFKVFNYLPENFTTGADMSWIDERLNGNKNKFIEGGQELHPYDLVKGFGMDYIRLRVWNNPTNGWCNMEHTLKMAKEVKSRGLKLGIDFHYSDNWADPSKQYKPAAWKDLTFDELVQAVYDYTYQGIAALKAQGTVPDTVQIGNEIINGILWSDGQIPWSSDFKCPDDDPSWDRLATLIKSGIKATKDALSPEDKTKIELHAVMGKISGEGKTISLYRNLINRDVQFDIIGLSYYPDSHGTLDVFESRLNKIANTFPQDIMIAETSYPAGGTVLHPGYPTTIQGQADFIKRVFQMCNDLPDGKGKGVLVWEPTDWQAMFTRSGGTYQANDSMNVFNKTKTVFPISAKPLTINTVKGIKPVLPATVDVLMSNGTNSKLNVTWDSVPSSNYDNVGSFSVAGTVQGLATGATINVTVEIDDQAPVTTATKTTAESEKNSEWCFSPVTVGLSAIDDKSGVESTQYRIGETGNWTTYTQPIIFENSGVFKLQYRSVDKAGNVETVKEETIKMNKINSITLSSSATSLERTKTAQLSVKANMVSAENANLPAGATVTYTSSNPDYVGVDAKGVITAKKAGSAEITAVATLNNAVIQSNIVTIKVTPLLMDSVQFKITTDKPIVEILEDVTAKIEVKGAKNLYGYDVTFNYDPEFYDLDLNNLVATNGFKIVGKKIDNGKVTIIASLLGAESGITGDFDILNIKLKAKNQDALAYLKIASGAMVANHEGGEYTALDPVTINLPVANADLTGGGYSIGDIVQVARSFGTSKEANPLSYNPRVDMDKDGKIDIMDISYVALKVLA
jgi:arabinogalactan endo-1,4-beta-galactosidase